MTFATTTIRTSSTTFQLVALAGGYAVARLGPPDPSARQPNSAGGKDLTGPKNSVISKVQVSIQSNSNRPPQLIVIAAVVNALIPAVLLVSVGVHQAGPLHILGMVFGMFLAIALLGLFRQRLSVARSNRRFLDWRIASSLVMSTVTVLSWLAGVANLFVICYDLSRNFTS